MLHGVIISLMKMGTTFFIDNFKISKICRALFCSDIMNVFEFKVTAFVNVIIVSRIL